MRRPRGMCWRRDCKPGSHQRSAGRGGGRPVRVGRWCGARRCSRRSSSWTASSASWSAWPARAAARRAPAPASAGPRRTCPPRPHGARPPARPRPARPRRRCRPARRPRAAPRPAARTRAPRARSGKAAGRPLGTLFFVGPRRGARASRRRRRRTARRRSGGGKQCAAFPGAGGQSVPIGSLAAKQHAGSWQSRDRGIGSRHGRQAADCHGPAVLRGCGR